MGDRLYLEPWSQRGKEKGKGNAIAIAVGGGANTRAVRNQMHEMNVPVPLAQTKKKKARAFLPGARCGGGTCIHCHHNIMKVSAFARGTEKALPYQS